MILAGHYTNDYRILRRSQIMGLFDVGARVLSGSKPDPLYRLPEMRPAAEILLGPQSGQSKGKIADAPKTPNAGPDANAKGGKAKGVGSFAGKISALVKKSMFGPAKKPLLDDTNDDESEGEESLFWCPMVPQPCFSGGEPLKKNFG